MRTIRSLLTVGFGVVAGCATGPGDGQQVSLSAGVEAAGSAAADSITLAGHTLVFDQVEVVLRKIELERAHDDCGDSSGSGSNDDCEEFEAGPMLLDLPLSGGPDRLVTIAVDSGTYHEVEFEIHKPEDDHGDAQFLAEHPDFRRVSIRARGRFDGEAFVYQTDLNVEQEHDLVPPLVVSERAATNLTLTVTLVDWFKVGGGLVNPLQALKGQQFESAVVDNIKRSFRVFEDRDRDGHEDDD